MLLLRLTVTTCLYLFTLGMQAQVFNDVATQMGIIHTDNSTRPGGGVSFADFDGDGFDDLTFATAAGESLRFYKNTSTGLSLLSDPTGNLAEVKQILWVDYDNDGDQDLFCSSFDGPVFLYRRDGDWSFTEVTAAAGIPVVNKRHYGAAFGDYDRDGWVDLYYSQRKLVGQLSASQNRMFRNQADGTFAEVTNLAGVADPGRIPFCIGFTDYDGDRWPDLYVANDRDTRNTLFRNQADGTFTDVSEDSGAGISIDAMNMGLGDYDNDGDEDIFVTNIEEGCKLLRNNSDGTFTEVADETGVGFYGIGWGASWIDGDLDGDLDLYVSGAIVGSDAVSSAYYRNDGMDGFSEPANAGFVGDTVYSWSNAVGDFNRDNVLDIAVLNQAPFSSQLWENQGDGSFIGLQLTGVLSNRDGIGTKVELYGGQNGYQSAYTHCGSGFLAQQSRTVRFGLGNLAQIDSMVITWPTGHQDFLVNPTANVIHLLTEGSTTDGNIEVDEDVLLTPNSTYAFDPAEPTLIISPNPVQKDGQLWLGVEIEEYFIYSITGQQVKRGKLFSTDQSIKVSGLSTGTYFMVALTKSGHWTRGSFLID